MLWKATNTKRSTVYHCSCINTLMWFFLIQIFNVLATLPLSDSDRREMQTGTVGERHRKTETVKKRESERERERDRERERERETERDSETGVWHATKPPELKRGHCGYMVWVLTTRPHLHQFRKTHTVWFGFDWGYQTCQVSSLQSETKKFYLWPMIYFYKVWHRSSWFLYSPIREFHCLPHTVCSLWSTANAQWDRGNFFVL